MSDRYPLPFDLQNLTSLTQDNQRVPPTVGIRDTPVRCFKVNLEWCVFVAGAISELTNVRAWSGATDERHAAIQQILSMLEGDDCVDCEDVEDCLGTSDTITNITTNLTNVTEAQEECCEQTSQVANVYPPAPGPAVTLDLCSAAVYVAQKLSDLWHDVVTDAQTITWAEFVENLIPGGGNDVGLLKLLWDFVVSNSNPSLIDEGEAAFDEVVGYLFCNEFDRDLTDLDIDASSTITSDAKGLWRGALSSVTDGKIATWVYLGSLAGLSSGQCLCQELCGVHDFGVLAGDWEMIPGFPVSPAWDTTNFWHSVPDDNPVGNDFDALYLRLAFADTAIERVDIYFDFDHYEFTHSGSVQLWQLLHDGSAVDEIGTTQETMIEGDNQLVTLTADGALVDEIRILMTAWIGPGIPTPPQGYARVRKVVIVCSESAP